MKHELRLHRDHEHLCRSVAAALAECLRAAAAASGQCSLVLAGGSTPRLLYTLLAGEFAEAVPWDRLHLFWGDERYVPHDDPASNFGTARHILIDRVPIPDAHVHPIPTHYAKPGTGASVYARRLRGFFDGEPPRFDVVLLGMGADGHTASLFPGSPALEARGRWVATATAPQAPHQRLTLTLPVFNQARNVYFLVSGTRKAEALRCAFGQPSRLASCPAARVDPQDGNLLWWVDADAAGEL